ncbi:MAG TPA: hypothetical protein VF003_11090 [Pseudonocardiaceae bacterium]
MLSQRELIDKAEAVAEFMDLCCLRRFGRGAVMPFVGRRISFRGRRESVADLASDETYQWPEIDHLLASR